MILLGATSLIQPTVTSTRSTSVAPPLPPAPTTSLLTKIVTAITPQATAVAVVPTTQPSAGTQVQVTPTPAPGTVQPMFVYHSPTIYPSSTGSGTTVTPLPIVAGKTFASVLQVVQQAKDAAATSATKASTAIAAAQAAAAQAAAAQAKAAQDAAIAQAAANAAVQQAAAAATGANADAGGAGTQVLVTPAPAPKKLGWKLWAGIGAAVAGTVALAVVHSKHHG